MSSGSRKTLLLFLLYPVMGVFLFVSLIVYPRPAAAAVGVNKQVNFQGRLLNSAGATAPDGNYNVEFKVYQDGDGLTAGDATGSPAGSLKWHEDYLNSASQGVAIRNGYLSVQLGSVTPFGATVDWNQDTLWLSVNIGSTGSCTIITTFNANCGGDGEMVPMKRLSSTPYSLNSGLLGGLASSQFVQLAQGVQTEAGISTNSIFINKTGTGGNFIDLQAAGTDAFTLNNSGDATFGNNANHSISVTTAGAGIAGKSLTLTAGAAGTGGSALAGGDLVLQGGAGGGTNGNGGNITIDAGAKNGTGTGGNINIGNTNASTVNIATNAAAHTITIANGAAAQSITIGSTNTTSSLLLQAGSNGISSLLIQAQGGTLGIGNNAAAQTIAIGNTTGATAVNIQSGSGSINLTGTAIVNGSLTVSGSNTFASGTGTVSLQGATSVSANFGVTGAGNVAFQKGTDYSSATVNDINFGSGALIRLTGGSAQTIGGIAGGSDGRIITLINTSTTLTDTIKDKSGSGSLAVNQISTGTGLDLSLPAGASVSLVYDSGASLWRVVGSSAASGGYIQLQGASPTQQTGYFNISGTGLAANFDSTGTTLGIGTSYATTLNIATNGVAHNVNIANGAAAQAVIIGSTNTTSTLALQGGTGASAITLQTGNNGTTAGGIQIGNTTGAFAQTINIGNNATASSSSTVVIGSTVAGNITLQSAATINIGQNAAAQTIQIGNTAVGTTIAERVGGAYSLDGVAGSTYTLGASTTTGSVTIGGTAQSGGITLGSSTATNTLTLAGGSGATTLNIANVQNGGSVNIGNGLTTGTISIGGTGAQTGTIGIGTGTGAQSLNFGTGGTGAKTVFVGSTASTGQTTIQSGSGGISLSGATSVSGANSFSTGTGAVTIQGATSVSANLTVTNTANIAFQKGADYSATVGLNNVNFGTGALIRLTGASTQTITGIAGGVDGRVLTLVNAAGQSATLSYLSASSSAANQINTGTGGDLAVPAGASVSLVYDAGSTIWRVIGSSAAAGGYIQLQATSAGTQQSGNFNISGTGLASTFDSTGTTLNIGTNNATAVNIATNNVAHTIGIGTDTTTTQGITIGSTSGASALLLQAGTGNLSVQTQGGTLGIGNNGVSQSLVIGNTTLSGGGASATSVTVFCGTGSCSFGAGATNHTTTIGTTNGTATTTIQSGTGGINVGTANVAETIQIGSGILSTGTQSIYLGTSAGGNGAGITNVTIGATTSGTVTLQSGSAISIGANATAQTISIGSTTSGTTIAERVGGAYSLDGVAGSTYTLGASTTTGSVTIGGTAQSGGITLGSSTATNTLTLAGGSGATTLNIANVQNGGSVNIGNGLTTGTISIGGTGAQTGNIDIGLGTGIQSLTFGTGGTGAKTVTVGSTAGASQLTLQGGTNGASLDSGTGNITIGTSANNKILNIGAVGTTANTTTVNIASTSGAAQTVTIGSTNGASVTALQGGTSGTGISLQTGGGALNIGTNNTANTVQIGSGILGSGIQQAIYLGTSASGNGAGTTNVTIGAGSGAGGGLTTVQAKGNVVFSTNGIVRGTFDTANDFYFGNGVSASAPNNFVIQGTGSTTTAVAGGNITLQGGNATVGTANGGIITLTGGTGVGTGVTGSVILATPTFQTAGSQSCSSNCTVTQANVDSNGAVIINATAAALTVSLGNPTITTAGKIIYVTAANGSNDFTLSVNGGGTGNTIAMRQNTTATMIWSGSAWTAAGASSSTTLQSAYDNTLTSAGGAELITSKTSNHDGLTIRDSSTTPVNGTLLEVQTANASTLFAVNGAVTDYATNGGAETAGGSSTTFPASTWSTFGAGVTLTRNTVAGSTIGTGQASVSVATGATATSGTKDTLSGALTANLNYNVSFGAILASGTFNTMNVYYSIDGTAQSVACATGQSTATSVWTKINCVFTAPSSGITANNAILVYQSDGTARTFYIDNLSVTISASQNYATDGSVDDNTNFGTNWTAVAGTGATVSAIRAAIGNDTSDSAEAHITVGGSVGNNGIRNKLSINPLATNPGTLYRISVYVASTTIMSDLNIRYSRDGGTSFDNCVDYNLSSVPAGTSSFTQITCYVTPGTTAPTNPYIYFTESGTSVRDIYIDTFSMSISSNAVPNVQIGGGVYGGPTTLFTLDRGASAPIAANNASLLGSMYYDTTIGKLQCYESDGWGACGSSPDNIITISPEYTNAVLHGSGVGTMTSDICSGALGINDGSSSQPTICGANETYNFYKWTSPQASAQTYSIYVTYQLPSTFKAFNSGQTSLLGRTDSTNSTVQYSVYRSHSGSALVQCGSAVSVSTGVQSSWISKTATGTADPSTCSFAASDSIVFKIDVIANSNADAYVSNLNFAFSNK